jgi:hypothetical protein
MPDLQQSTDAELEELLASEGGGQKSVAPSRVERAKRTSHRINSAKEEPGAIRALFLWAMPLLCGRRSSRAGLHNAHECEFPSHDPPTNRH